MEVGVFPKFQVAFRAVPGPWPPREVVHDMQGQDALGRRTKLGWTKIILCQALRSSALTPTLTLPDSKPPDSSGLGMEVAIAQDRKKSRLSLFLSWALGCRRNRDTRQWTWRQVGPRPISEELEGQARGAERGVRGTDFFWKPLSFRRGTSDD